MQWLNYHHLRYFWAVAREGSLARAAAKLSVSQPSISAQIHELEAALGEQLFRKEGRNNTLTDAGEVVFGYAEEIFALGGDMLNALKNRPGARTVRLNVGVADSFPKRVTYELLKPVFDAPPSSHVVCREGKLVDLLALLSAHRLDVVLCDGAAPSNSNFQTVSHFLGDTGTTLCAERTLAKKLKRQFPRSLHQSPALLPASDTPLRRGLELWFREAEIEPRIVAEFDDLALMNVMAAEGLGFIALPSLAARDALEHYGYLAIGELQQCRVPFYAVTAARRLGHPAVDVIIRTARGILSQGELNG